MQVREIWGVPRHPRREMRPKIIRRDAVMRNVVIEDLYETTGPERTTDAAEVRARAHTKRIVEVPEDDAARPGRSSHDRIVSGDPAIRVAFSRP